MAAILKKLLDDVIGKFFDTLGKNIVFCYLLLQFFLHTRLCRLIWFEFFIEEDQFNRILMF